MSQPWGEFRRSLEKLSTGSLVDRTRAGFHQTRHTTLCNISFWLKKKTPTRQLQKNDLGQRFLNCKWPLPGGTEEVKGAGASWCPKFTNKLVIVVWPTDLPHVWTGSSGDTVAVAVEFVETKMLFAANCVNIYTEVSVETQTEPNTLLHNNM